LAPIQTKKRAEPSIDSARFQPSIIFSMRFGSANMR
jgi:hypothetical protein